MRLSYGWPDGQENSAFRDRSLPLDSKKPCIMIGRNGSGKTLASKILSHSRTILFGEEREFKQSFSAIRDIGLDWIEVEFKIPLIQFSDEGDGQLGFSRGNSVAWDLIEDEKSGLWLFTMSEGDMNGMWEPEYHSFTTNIFVKLILKKISVDPELSVSIMMESRGTLELCNDQFDESLYSDHDTEEYKHFSIDIVSKPVNIEIQGSFASNQSNNLWKRVCTDTFTPGTIENLRKEYQRQYQYVCKNLDNQCIEGGYGTPELGEYGVSEQNLAWLQKSTIVEILFEEGKKIFPPIEFSNVDRVPPEFNPWKKDLLEELVSLRATIIGKLDVEIDEYGIGCEMLLQILNDFEELRPGTKLAGDQFIQAISNDVPPEVSAIVNEEKKQKEYLDDLFKEYSHLEKWLDIIPLFVQNRVPESSKIEKIGIQTNEFSSQILELREHVDFIKILLNAIDECFPKFDDFEKADDKYSILINSISKFQQSDAIEQMYLQGVTTKLIDDSSQRTKPNSAEMKELSRLIPRYMVLFWYAFEMDRELIALYETYRGIFSSDNDRNKEAHQIGTTSWSEFLHIIEDKNAMPSGFRHILSIVLGITSNKESCIYFIDEPEISLHIEWQRKLVTHLRFLLDESRNNSILLIATHSPDIFLNHLDDIVNFSPQMID
jgi:energy-coupling factor transporter ATP-binding protein EcfA2